MSPIGPKGQKILNKVFQYSDESINQLTKWMKTRFLFSTVSEETKIPLWIGMKKKSFCWMKGLGPYLDINCGHCP